MCLQALQRFIFLEYHNQKAHSTGNHLCQIIDSIPALSILLVVFLVLHSFFFFFCYKVTSKNSNAGVLSLSLYELGA